MWHAHYCAVFSLWIAASFYKTEKIISVEVFHSSTLHLKTKVHDVNSKKTQTVPVEVTLVIKEKKLINHIKN